MNDSFTHRVQHRLGVVIRFSCVQVYPTCYSAHKWSEDTPVLKAAFFSRLILQFFERRSGVREDKECPRSVLFKSNPLPYCINRLILRFVIGADGQFRQQAHQEELDRDREHDDSDHGQRR